MSAESVKGKGERREVTEYSRVGGGVCFGLQGSQQVTVGGHSSIRRLGVTNPLS